MKKLFALLLVLTSLTALTACHFPSGDSPEPTVAFTPIRSSAEYFRTLNYVDQRTQERIDYLFHEPVRNTGKKYPLIIYLHGLGEHVSKTSLGYGRALVDSLITLENRSDEYSTYTLIPSTPHSNQGWWTTNQLNAFKKLIKEVIAKCNVDPARIYISGLSMGGMTTCQLVNEMPNTFAAAVPLSGVRTLTTPNMHHKTAFLIYHSTTDTTVSVSGARNLYAQLRQAGHPNAKLIEFPRGTHTSLPETVFRAQAADFFPWLFSQRLS